MTKAWHPARYRAQQFLAALRPRISAADRQLIQMVFQDNRAALALFERMPAADQAHAVAVLHTLREQGEVSFQLQQAALLHDVGKSRGQPLFYRVAVVILNALWPALLHRLGRAPLHCPAWRRPFVVHAHHPHIGADWARAAGCDPVVIILIDRHQQRPPQPARNQTERLQNRLYEADNVN